MTPSWRIALSVAVTYGRSLVALVCGLVTGRWALVTLGAVDYGILGLLCGLVTFVTLQDRLFPFGWFPVERGLRWQWYDKSPEPRKGLRFLRNKPSEAQTKNDYAKTESRTPTTNLRCWLRHFGKLTRPLA